MNNESEKIIKKWKSKLSEEHMDILSRIVYCFTLKTAMVTRSQCYNVFMVVGNESDDTDGREIVQDMSNHYEFDETDWCVSDTEELKSIEETTDDDQKYYEHTPVHLTNRLIDYIIELPEEFVRDIFTYEMRDNEIVPEMTIEMFNRFMEICQQIIKD